MTYNLRSAAAGIAILCTSVLGACSDEPNDGVLTELAVVVAKPSIAVGETVQATATGIDQYNRAIPTGDVAWSATGGATISATGVVTGIEVGQSTIKATVVARAISAEKGVAVIQKAATNRATARAF